VVRGTVLKAVQSSKGDERSALTLRFTELEIEPSKIAVRVTGVENAREIVDAEGQILGILTGETISGRLDSGLTKLAERASSLAGILGTVKGAVLKAPESDITYEPGVELVLALTAPIELKASGPGPRPS
jgi:hypothetical protein